MGDPRDLYRELVMDHARSPRNHGPLPDGTHQATGYNPLCGDKVILHLAIDGGGVVEAAAFEGQGCAIAMAAASTLTEAVVGRSVTEVAALEASFHALVGGTEPIQDMGDLAFFSVMTQFPSRKKCATLPWTALAAALRGDDEPVTTE